MNNMKTKKKKNSPSNIIFKRIFFQQKLYNILYIIQFISYLCFFVFGVGNLYKEWTFIGTSILDIPQLSNKQLDT